MNSANEQSRPPSALVVGGSGGIGLAVCERFVEAGWRVHATSRRARRSPSPGIRWLALDAADRAAVRGVFARLEADEEGLDAVVWAAGADIAQPYVSQVEVDDWHEAHRVETNGAFYVAQASIPSLRHRRGALCFVTSAANRRYSPGDILSAAPKASIEAVSRAIAVEEGKFGVRSNCVAVGVVDDGIFHRLRASGALDEAWVEAAKRHIPLRRFGRAAEVAECVEFLCSRRARYVSGQVLSVDGGYSA